MLRRKFRAESDNTDEANIGGFQDLDYALSKLFVALIFCHIPCSTYDTEKIRISKQPQICRRADSQHRLVVSGHMI